jgi:hypothetical protein
LVAAVASQSVSAAEKTAKLATVRIGYVSRSILDMPYIIARDRVSSAKRAWNPS